MSAQLTALLELVLKSGGVQRAVELAGGELLCTGGEWDGLVFASRDAAIILAPEQVERVEVTGEQVELDDCELVALLRASAISYGRASLPETLLPLLDAADRADELAAREEYARKRRLTAAERVAYGLSTEQLAVVPKHYVSAEFGAPPTRIRNGR